MGAKIKEGPSVLFWFRRDLRLYDNEGLHRALLASGKVLPVFVFDKVILDDLEERDDPRVTFIYREILKIKAKLKGWGSDLLTYYGTPMQAFIHWKEKYPEIEAVFTNHDFEVYAKNRDKEIAEFLKQNGVKFNHFKDHVIFEGKEIVTAEGNPMSVYSPYAKKWRDFLTDDMLEEREVEGLKENFFQVDEIDDVPTLASMNFWENDFPFPEKKVTPAELKEYAESRNFPAADGTTHLSLHLRFGTVSIRQAVKAGLQYSDKWLSELIWRDFYAQVLDNNPRVEQESFRPEYDNIKWRNNEAEFKAWCQGKTGYPMVDAGMRQLNTEHWMHNRLRMVTASFLCKHLLIDWRWGDAYFARKLLDYDLASNNGGWQWAAGSGTDAAPYFRIFNPSLQWEKFDKKSEFVRQYVPEYQSQEYISNPIVEHNFARKRALEVYAKAVKKS